MRLAEELYRKGFLLSPGVEIKAEELKDFIDFVRSRYPQAMVITKQMYEEYAKRGKEKVEIKGKIEVLKSWKMEGGKEVKDWLLYYLSRYDKLKEILLKRAELREATSIERIKKSRETEVQAIGMVKEIRRSAKGHAMLEVEDPTSSMRVVVRKEMSAYEKVKELVQDEVIGIIGRKGDSTIFVERIIFPDIPSETKPEWGEEGYACFIGDFHYGSKAFLSQALDRFIAWANGKIGNEGQRMIASNLKYIFITGDLVDGIGIYEGQERELEVKDIEAQYEGVAELLSQLPEELIIVACPGNHDAVRMAEPQPPFSKEFAKALFSLPNLILVSNPALVRTAFGIKILLYHGYSIDKLVSDVPFLQAGGYEKAHLIGEFMLKKRHLAPLHGSTPLIPAPQDALVIEDVPHIFAYAHIHRASVGKYKNVLTACCSCWQRMTDFQRKVGHMPEPCRAIVVDLSNGGVRIFKFRK